MTSLFSHFLLQHLYVVVQPIVHSKTREVHFFEILSRVKYGNEIHMPNDFIPEMSIDMRYKLAKYLFHYIGDLQEQYPEISFSINLSSLEIDMGIEAYLSELLRSNECNIDSSRCIIEITEHSSINDETTYESIKNIKEKFGFRFALDDFGSKYATLNKVYSDQEVFDYIKVDGSLIQGIVNNPMKQLNFIMMIDFIQKNNKKAIVEYISSNEIYQKVMELAHPDYLQGYLFGKPVSIQDFLTCNEKKGA